MADEIRIDTDGVLYQRGFLSSGWIPKQGLLGPEVATNIWGSPQIKHDLFGPVRGQEGFFGPSHTWDGKPLYEADLPQGYGGGRDGGGGLGGILIAIYFWVEILTIILVTAISILLFYEAKRIYSAWGDVPGTGTILKVALPAFVVGVAVSLVMIFNAATRASGYYLLAWSALVFVIIIEGCDLHEKWGGSNQGSLTTP